MGIYWSSSKPPATESGLADFMQQLNSMSPEDMLALGLVAAVVILLLMSTYFFMSWCKEKHDKLDLAISKMETTLKCREMTLKLIKQDMTILKKLEDNMHLALYQSEARRRAKARRPSRPMSVEIRSPGLLANLRAARCCQGGVAVLEITDEEDQRSTLSCRSQRSRREDSVAGVGSGETASSGGIPVAGLPAIAYHTDSQIPPGRAESTGEASVVGHSETMTHGFSPKPMRIRVKK